MSNSKTSLTYVSTLSLPKTKTAIQTGDIVKLYGTHRIDMSPAFVSSTEDWAVVTIRPDMFGYVITFLNIVNGGVDRIYADQLDLLFEKYFDNDPNCVLIEIPDLPVNYDITTARGYDLKDSVGGIREEKCWHCGRKKDVGRKCWWCMNL